MQRAALRGRPGAPLQRLQRLVRGRHGLLRLSQLRLQREAPSDAMQPAHARGSAPPRRASSAGAEQQGRRRPRHGSQARERAAAGSAGGRLQLRDALPQRLLRRLPGGLPRGGLAQRLRQLRLFGLARPRLARQPPRGGLHLRGGARPGSGSAPLARARRPLCRAGAACPRPPCMQRRSVASWALGATGGSAARAAGGRTSCSSTRAASASAFAAEAPSPWDCAVCACAATSCASCA